MNSKPKKLLLLCYYWPPSGGGGVQRWLKLSKYLTALGVDVKIVTVNPAYAIYPQLDESLLADEEGLNVTRTKAIKLEIPGKKKMPFGGSLSPEKPSLMFRLVKWIRGNVIFPDPRVGWNPYAYKEACRLIISEGYHHVITSSPPHSTQLIGLKLKKRFGKKISWIADLRDPWTDIYYFHQLGIGNRMLSKHKEAERRVVEECDDFITVGESLLKMYLSKSARALNKGKVVYNGYDESDFPKQLAVSDAIAPVDLSYMGTMAENYGLEGFIQALKQVTQPVKLRFVGHVSGNWQQELNTLGNEKVSIDWVPEVPHSKVPDYLAASKALLLVIPKVVNNECIITGKIFEYLRSNKPILGIGPMAGDAASIVSYCGSGAFYDYENVEGILSFVLQPTMEAVSEQERSSRIEKYSRQNQALELERFLFPK